MYQFFKRMALNASFAIQYKLFSLDKLPKYAAFCSSRDLDDNLVTPFIRVLTYLHTAGVAQVNGGGLVGLMKQAADVTELAVRNEKIAHPIIAKIAQLFTKTGEATGIRPFKSAFDHMQNFAQRGIKLIIISTTEFSGKEGVRSGANVLPMIASNIFPRLKGLTHKPSLHIIGPGGYGTFDELTTGGSTNSYSLFKNTTCGRQPIVIMNHGGFYNGFLKQLKTMGHHGTLTYEKDMQNLIILSVKNEHKFGQKLMNWYTQNDPTNLKMIAVARKVMEQQQVERLALKAVNPMSANGHMTTLPI